MSDWYSRAREEDGRTDDEVMSEVAYKRDALQQPAASTISRAVWLWFTDAAWHKAVTQTRMLMRQYRVRRGA